MIPFYFYPPNSFFVIHRRLEINVDVCIKKCQNRSLKFECALLHVQHIQSLMNPKRAKVRDLLWELKNKSALMHVQIRAWWDPDQLQGRQTTAKRDGSSCNVPEIQWVALHTDPRQFSPKTHGRSKRTNLTNPQAKKSRIGNV